MSLGDILKATKLRKRAVTEIVEGLLLEGKLKHVSILNSNNHLYELLN